MLADQPNQPGGYAGKALGEFDPVSVVEAAAAFNGLVFPRDAEQVGRVGVPHADAFQAVALLGRNRRRVFLLSERGDDDVALSAMPGGTFHDFLIDWLA